MSLEARREELRGGGGERIRLFSGNTPLSYEDFLSGVLEDDSFAERFGRLIAASPYAAFFWETPAVTAATLDQAFEFVLVEAHGLSGRAEPDAFAEHFRGRDVENGVATFWSLGGDALLVAPCPSAHTPLDSHAHLAAYLRAATPEEARSLWRGTARGIHARLSDRPLWVSTSGLGVAWLHVRLDARPKYYQYAPYREAPGARST